MILSQMNFILASTFLHTTIVFHYLKIMYGMDIEMSFFNHSSMNKTMGVVIISENNHFVVLDVANKL